MPAMRNHTRTIVAALISPLVVPALFFLLHVFLNPHAGVAIVLFFSGCMAYAGLIGIGVPGMYMLRRAGKLGRSSLLAVGAVGGVVVYFVFVALVGFMFGNSLPQVLAAFANISASLVSAVTGIILGVLVAFTFSVVAGITVRSSGRDIRAA